MAQIRAMPRHCVEKGPSSHGPGLTCPWEMLSPAPPHMRPHPVFDQKYPHSKSKPEACFALQGWSRLFPKRQSFLKPPFILEVPSPTPPPPYLPPPTTQTEKPHLVILPDTLSPRSSPEPRTPVQTVYFGIKESEKARQERKNS